MSNVLFKTVSNSVNSKAAVIKIYIERKLEKPVSDSKMLFISLVLRLSRDIARAPGATFPQVFLLRL